MTEQKSAAHYVREEVRRRMIGDVFEAETLIRALPIEAQPVTVRVVAAALYGLFEEKCLETVGPMGRGGKATTWRVSATPEQRKPRARIVRHGAASPAVPPPAPPAAVPSPTKVGPQTQLDLPAPVPTSIGDRLRALAADVDRIFDTTPLADLSAALNRRLAKS